MSHRDRGLDNGWSEQGGYMKAKIRKLDEQFTSEQQQRQLKQSTSQLFHPPASQLRALIQAHGGKFQAYYSRTTVTHVIASRLPTGKINRLTDQKLVSAKWITDSIEAGKRLPWQPFQLYPGGQMGGRGQQKLRVVQAAVPEPTGEEETNSITSEILQSELNETVVEDSNLLSRGDLSDGLEKDQKVYSRSLDVNRARRVKQQCLEAYVSPPKPSTSSAQIGKSTGPTSLKQLLKGSTMTHPVDPDTGLFKQTSHASVDSPKASSTLVTTNTTGSIDPLPLAPSADAQLATFYARSRLHHLSTWANELRSLVLQLRTDTETLGLQTEAQRWRQSMIVPNESHNQIVLEAQLTTPARGRSNSPLVPKSPRTLLHIDMDCFFVSVSLRSRPELKNKPVAITHAKGLATDGTHGRNAHNSMSEVASCSYAARKAGVRNGMLLCRAMQLCPDLTMLPYDFDAYKAVSEVLYRTVAEYTLDIEAVSCDELYADCTDLLTVAEPHTATSTSSEQEPIRYRLIDPVHLARLLRALVSERTGGCTASVGLGTSKLLARLATKRAKPDGQCWLLGCSSANLPGSSIRWRWYPVGSPEVNFQFPADVELIGSDAEWLSDLSVGELPGVGRTIIDRLSSAFGVSTCGELQSHVTLNQLTELLGTKTGERVFWLCRGRDPTDILQLERTCKSVSACMNYAIRLNTINELDDLVHSLVQELASRMAAASVATSTRSRGVLGRNLTTRVFVRAPNAPIESAKFLGHGICNKSSRMISLAEPTADVATLHRSVMSVLRHLCPDPRELRGLGLQMNRLCPAGVQSRSNTAVRESLTESFGPPHFSETPVTDSPITEETTPIVVRHRRHRSLRLKRRRSSSDVYPSTDTHSNSDLSTHEVIEQPELTPNSSLSVNTNLSPVSPTKPNLLNTETRTIPKSNQEQLYSSTPLARRLTRRSETICRTQPLYNSHQIDVCPVRAGDSPIRDSNVKTTIIIADETDTSLFANKTMEEFRQLIANWITSEPYPLFEDVCILASYLVSLVPFNLEGVRLRLLCLIRLVVQLCGSSTQAQANGWQTAVRQIKVTVNAAVGQCYGHARLHLYNNTHVTS